MLKFKLVSENAILPKRAEAGSAGYDLFCPENTIISPGETKIIDLGIIWDPSELEIEDNYVWRADVRSRSGLAFKLSIESFHGLIDESYRGNWMIKLTNNHPNAVHTIVKGDRIAQFIVTKTFVPEVVQTDEVSTTTRSTGGFGSTGN